MTTNRVLVALVAVIGLMATWVWTGCEQAGNTSGVSISPSTVTLGGGTNTSGVVFTALVSDGLALPVKWSVGNPAMGYIASASGSNATYVANTGKEGVNLVTVKDQFGNEASAVINQ